MLRSGCQLDVVRYQKGGVAENMQVTIRWPPPQFLWSQCAWCIVGGYPAYSWTGAMPRAMPYSHFYSLIFSTLQLLSYH